MSLSKVIAYGFAPTNVKTKKQKYRNKTTTSEMDWLPTGEHYIVKSKSKDWMIMTRMKM